MRTSPSFYPIFAEVEETITESRVACPLSTGYDTLQTRQGAGVQCVQPDAGMTGD